MLSKVNKCYDSRDVLLMVLLKYSSDDMYLFSATFVFVSVEYDTIEDFCSNGHSFFPLR